MSFDVIPIPEFVKELKGLAKKYRSLRSELAELGNALAEEPHMGTPLGRDCYKIRLAIKSKGAGKSGGARVITCVVAVREEVYLLAIYDKSEQATLTDKRLKELLKQIPR
ncbi:MAG TPA: type II toxin-antitoxin system RelE/ParE family toxin [Flavobacteriales bacterium]|nr:type II toxin-antitoxin system RelE/ParE family toxin [Flavobacteriales bacterium]HMR29177.1 type II toxin-antitoxin system RelE/ParE family toxin [Flavobacteriales bacterium]